MKVAYEEYQGEFTGFERRGGDVPKEDKEDAMLRYMQSFDKKGEVAIGILSSMNETMKSVKEDTSQMLEKQDMMIEKQDRMLEKQDDTIEVIGRSKEEIVTEISSLRGDLRSYMENKFSKIEHEIEGIPRKQEKINR